MLMFKRFNEKRKQGSNSFEKYFFKLINNIVNGRTYLSLLLKLCVCFLTAPTEILFMQ